MRVLVINCGSSSLKYAVYDTVSREALTRGLVERIGGAATLKRAGSSVGIAAPSHTTALKIIATLEDFTQVQAVGHRVVHGGLAFSQPVIVSDAVLRVLEENVGLAPLHNPPNIAGIKAVSAALPSLENIAVFDTGFHSSLPEFAYRYAISPSLGTELRRYGFHGTSHQFVA